MLLRYLSYSSGFLNLNWNTDCNHLNRDGTARTHHFLIKAIDNHCPIPAMLYETISITVIPPLGGCNLTTKVTDNFVNELEYIQVYPNPTKGVFYLGGLNLESSYEADVIYIQGQVVQELQINNQNALELELKGKAGIYFIQLTNEKGERVNLKVVKQ